VCVCVCVCVYEKESEVGHGVPLSKNPLVAHSSSSNDSAKKSLAAKMKGSSKTTL